MLRSISVDWIKIFVLGVSLFVSIHGQANQVNKPYTFYVVPQTSPVSIHRAWIPVLQRLSKETGFTFELKIPPTITAFESDLFKGKPDFAFMNPYHFILARKRLGYTGLVRDSYLPLKGIIVVKNDSLIRSIDELDGKELAFPSPNAFAASLYIRAILASKGIKVIPKYVNTHGNVYRNVLLEDVVAGGGINNTFDRESIEVRSQLRILYVTPSTCPHPLAASSRMPDEVREKVILALIKLASDPANEPMFDDIQMQKPVRVDYDRDYAGLETLRLDKFFVEDSDEKFTP